MRGVAKHGRLLQLNPREDQGLTKWFGIETRNASPLQRGFHMAFSLAMEKKLGPPLSTASFVPRGCRPCRLVLGCPSTRSIPVQMSSRLEEGRLQATLEGNDGFERTNEEGGSFQDQSARLDTGHRKSLSFPASRKRRKRSAWMRSASFHPVRCALIIAS
jgi:hypothetical protein